MVLSGPMEGLQQETDLKRSTTCYKEHPKARKAEDSLAEAKQEEESPGGGRQSFKEGAILRPAHCPSKNQAR